MCKCLLFSMRSCPAPSVLKATRFSKLHTTRQNYAELSSSIGSLVHVRNDKGSQRNSRVGASAVSCARRVWAYAHCLSQGGKEVVASSVCSVSVYLDTAALATVHLVSESQVWLPSPTVSACFRRPRLSSVVYDARTNASHMTSRRCCFPTTGR